MPTPASLQPSGPRACAASWRRRSCVVARPGVALANVGAGVPALLPVAPARAARHIRDALQARTGRAVAVVVSDTFGRPWRKGLVDVALGCAGIAAVVDLRGTE